MKQRILAGLILAVLLICLTPAAFASQPEPPLIVDQGGLLSPREEKALEELALEIREESQMDVVIVTVDTLGGKSARDYADDYYDDNGYGVGSRYSGVLLLIDIGSRQWYISTCGDAIQAISDWDRETLFDAMADSLSEGEYYRAFDRYLDALKEHLRQDSGGSGVKALLISVLVGLVAGGIGLLILRSGMNTRIKQSGAGDYLKQDSYQLRVHRDMFLYSRVTKRPRPKENSGSSVHRSSSGRSHGGGGGRF